MKINLKVRMKNPVFWASILIAVFAPILAALGISWESVTSWAKLWEIIVTAAKSPVIVVSVIVSVYNALIDPTTKGICDSERALSYEKPGGKS